MRLSSRFVIAVFLLVGFVSLGDAVVSAQTLLTVNVVDSDERKPVFGAAISFAGKTYRTSRTGKAYISVTKTDISSERISIRRPGFDDLEESVWVKNDAPDKMEVTFVLRRVRTLTVTVTDSEDKTPVADALVKLSPKNGESAFDGEARRTDSSGRVYLKLGKPGGYDIDVQHDNFDPVSSEFSFSQPASMEMAFSLERTNKTEYRRNLSVTVLGEQPSGDTKPIAGARLRWNRGKDVETTDAGGKASWGHVAVMGEELRVFASADGYEDGVSTVIVGKGNLTRDFKGERDTDVITLTLKRKKSNVIKIAVLDSVNDKPIAGARVNLEVGGAASEKSTNSAGEATFDLPPNAARTVAKVSMSGYQDKWSDVPAEMLVLKLEPSTFTVFLKKAGIDLTGEWKDDYGYKIMLTGDGSSFSGTFAKGSNKGTISGGVIDLKTCKVTFKYTEEWKNSTGKASFVLAPAGDEMGGSYESIIPGYSVPQKAAWTFYRISPARGVGCRAN